MVNRPSTKPRVDTDVVPWPEGVRQAAVVGEPLMIGSGTATKQAPLGAAHVSFKLKVAPDADVILCLDRQRTVGVLVRGEVSTRGLQRIPLRTLERFALALLRQSEASMRREGGEPGHTRWVERVGEGAPTLEEWAAHHEPWTRALEKATAARPVDAGSRERYLAKLAARYVVLCGESGRPTKVLADELCLSIATVRDQLADARRRKLLLPAGPGRAGGELTPKALSLLAVDEEG